MSGQSLREVRIRPAASEQIASLEREYPSLREAFDGAFRAIGYAGLSQAVVPNSRNQLRVVETRKGHGGTVPACSVYYTSDAEESCYWVERVVRLG